MSLKNVAFIFDVLSLTKDKDWYESINIIVDRVNYVIKDINNHFNLTEDNKDKLSITAQMGIKYYRNGLSKCKLVWFCNNREILQKIKTFWYKAFDRLTSIYNFNAFVEFNHAIHVKPSDKILSDGNNLSLNPLLFRSEAFKDEIKKRHQLIGKFNDRDDLLNYIDYGYTFLDFDLDTVTNNKVIANTYYKVLPDIYELTKLIINNKI